jgi:hypothetical protein
MFGDLAGTASDIEETPQAAKIEFSRAKQAFAHRRVQGDHAASGEHGSLRTVIDIPDFIPILLGADTPHQIVFHDSIKELSARPMSPRFLPGASSMMGFGLNGHGHIKK